MYKMKRGRHVFLATTMLFSTLAASAAWDVPIQASAVEATTIDFKTTLKDRTTKADRLTFDVWANDRATGIQIDKTQLTVTQNGKSVPINWHDSEKTSYTVNLQQGENTIVIEVKNGSDVLKRTYTVTQQAANDGDAIGDFVYSLETFTLGTGYLIEPQRVAVIKGLNSAQMLDEILTKNQFDYSHTGKLDTGFYLAHITKEGSPVIKKSAVRIPTVIQKAGASMGVPIDEQDLASESSLGEFDFSRGSGWMYSVNNVFPNVGFSDHFLQDEDVMRTQFTLLYGSDLGGGMVGENAFDAFSKDEATRALAYVNSSEEREEILRDAEVKEAYDDLMEEIQVVNPKQATLDLATGQLDGAVIDWAQQTTSREAAYMEDYTPEQKQFLNNQVSYEAQIDALKEVTSMTTADFEAYRAFKEKFDEQLAPNEQKLLRNYAKLQKIDTRYNELSVDIPIAQALQDKIKQLPKEDYIQLTDAEAIASIRKQYDALQATSKKLVKNYATFKAAEAQLTMLQSRQSLMTDIAALPETTSIAALDIEKDASTYEALNKKVNTLIDTFDAIGYDSDAYDQNIFSAKQYDILNYDKLFATKTAIVQLENRYTVELYKKIAALHIPPIVGRWSIIGGYTPDVVTKIETAMTYIKKIPQSQKSVADEMRLYAYGTPDIPSIEKANGVIQSDAYKAVKTWEAAIETANTAKQKQTLFDEFFAFTYAQQYEQYDAVDLKRATAFLSAVYEAQGIDEQLATLQKIAKTVPSTLATNTSGARHVSNLFAQFYDMTAQKELTDAQQETLSNQPVAKIASSPLTLLFQYYEVDKTFSFNQLTDYERANAYISELSDAQKKYLTSDVKAKLDKFNATKPSIDEQLKDYYAGNYEADSLQFLPYENRTMLQSDDNNRKKNYFLWDDATIAKGPQINESYNATVEKYAGNPLFSYVGNNGTHTFSPIDRVGLKGLKDSELVAVQEYIAYSASLPTLDALKNADRTTVAQTIDAAEACLKTIRDFEVKRALFGASFKVDVTKKRLANLAAAEVVVSQIDALPPLDYDALSSTSTYENVQRAYDALTAQQQQLVTNAADLQRWADVFSNIDAIQLVDQAIQAISTTVSLADADAITSARAAYDALPKSAQPFVQHYAQLQAAENDILRLNRIKAVNVLFAALPQVDALVQADEVRLKQARTAYDALSETEKTEVNGYAKLQTLEQAFAALQNEADAVQSVKALIGSLPAVASVKRADEAQIQQARKAYDALTDTQKLRISNYESLRRVEAKLAQLLADAPDEEKPLISFESSAEALADLSNKIAALPAYDSISLADGAQIQALYKAFNQLSATQQQLVPNQLALKVAVATYDALLAQDDTEKATIVSRQIMALPASTLLDVTDAQVVKEIRIAYTKLTAAQQQNVLNELVLSEAETQIAQLQRQVVDVQTAIATLPMPSQLSVKDATTLERVRVQYEALTTGQKKHVNNETILVELERQLASLQLADVRQVMDAIGQLPPTMTFAYEKTVQTIRTKFDALSTVDQSGVTNVARLIEAEQQLLALTNKEAAKAQVVTTQIQQLPMIVQKENAAAVQAARLAYNQLTVTQQLFVTNVDVLERAEARITTLTAFDRSKAAAASNLIDRLPIVRYVRVEDKKQITAARSAYDALTKTQRAYVTNLAQLQKVEKQLKTVTAKANALKAADVNLTVPTVYSTTATISGGVNSKAKVVLYKGTKKLKTATVSKAGTYKVTFARQKAGTKLKFVVYNELDKKLVQKTVSVKQTTVKAATSLKAKKKTVQGKATKNKKIYVLKNNKRIAAAKTNANGTFTVKTASQKVGTVLSIVVLDAFGNKSATKKVVVRS